MRSLACSIVLAAFLLASSPAIPAFYGGATPRVVYVMDAPAKGARMRRRNHYRGARA